PSFFHWRWGPTPGATFRRHLASDSQSSARRATPARLPRWGPRCGRRRSHDSLSRVMHFAHSDKSTDLQRRAASFMGEHSSPNDATYHQQSGGRPIADWKVWRPVSIIEELKPKARAAGLWNL